MGYNPHVSSDPITVRAASELTTSYVESSAMRAQNWNQLILFCDFTLGSSGATDARLQVEVASPAGDSQPVSGDWHVASFLDTANGTASGLTESVPYRQLEYVLPATGKYALPVPLSYKWFRVKAKASTTGAGTSLQIMATTGLA